jgi:hypothetical protein
MYGDRLAEAAFGERVLLMRPRADRLDDRRRLLPSQPGGHNGFHDLGPGP